MTVPLITFKKIQKQPLELNYKKPVLKANHLAYVGG